MIDLPGARAVPPANPMPAPHLNTAELHAWVMRLQAGDRAAADELIRAVTGRLEPLARRMLRRHFRNVAPFADTGDVLNSALVRLWRTLEQLPPPPSTRDFLNLAAAHLRRELLDLARYYSARGRDRAAPGAVEFAADAVAAEADDDLERWRDFHERVERLPAELREVVSLHFYHRWSHAEVAALLGLTERSARRRWREALEALHRDLRPDEGQG
jgi:RNA polymerase sigma factor (sigma-70 family)